MPWYFISPDPNIVPAIYETLKKFMYSLNKYLVIAHYVLDTRSTVVNRVDVVLAHVKYGEIDYEK